MQPQPLGVSAGHGDGPAGGVEARIIHGRGDRAGQGDEALDLLGLPAAAGEPVGQLGHVPLRAAGKGRHQVRHDVLPFAGAAERSRKDLQKSLEHLGRGLVHPLQHALADVLGGDLELPADELADQRPQVFRGFHRQVEAHPAGHPHVLDAAQPGDAPQQPGQLVLVDLQMPAARRKQAAHPRAFVRACGAAASTCWRWARRRR